MSATDARSFISHLQDPNKPLITRLYELRNNRGKLGPAFESVASKLLEEAERVTEAANAIRQQLQTTQS